jgi:uncharacterized lipoprotein YddW (UPF0748 family)
MKKISLLILILSIYIGLSSEIKAIWVPVWDMNTPAKIDSIVADAVEHNIEHIIAQVRYRGDALYVPNLYSNKYFNPDRRSHLLENDGFDPLQYFLELTGKNNLKLHAWLPVYVVTPHNLEPLCEQHIYFRYPNLITVDFNRHVMRNDSYEGAYLDPGLPQVNSYLFAVIMDLVSNYEIDGLHLDYVRYPDTNFGYHDIARLRYATETEIMNAESWSLWKEQQINNFVRKIYINTKQVKPKLIVSAAVIDDLQRAREKYSQNWKKWLDENYIDNVYLMAYTTSNARFEEIVDAASAYGYNDRIIVGLRAWVSGNAGHYPSGQIIDKIKMTRARNFAGFALFSYNGMKENGYFEGLRRILR